MQKFLTGVSFMFLSSLLLASPIKVNAHDFSSDISRSDQPDEQLGSSTGTALFKRDPAHIGQTNTKGSAEASGMANSLPTAPLPDFLADNKFLLKKIENQAKKAEVKKATEIGFLVGRSSNTDSIHANVVKDIKRQEYAVNFDGSELVYFAVPKMIDSVYSQPKKSGFFIFNKKHVFANEGNVLLSRNTRKSLIDNSINKVSIREANYILMNNGRIILGTKDVRENNLSERDNYVSQALDAIKNRAVGQTSENLLGTVWQPRNSNSIRYRR